MKQNCSGSLFTEKLSSVSRAFRCDFFIFKEKTVSTTSLGGMILNH